MLFGKSWGSAAPQPGGGLTWGQGGGAQGKVEMGLDVLRAIGREADIAPV